MHVLLVAPDGMETDEIAALLSASEQELRVVAAASLAEAQDALGGEPVDVVVLDLRAPDADGLAELSRLRAQTDAPIVALGASDDAGLATRAVREGAHEYLAEGDAPRLAGAIRAAVERAARRRELSFLASYDPLTGLQNRRALMLNLRHVLGHAERRDKALAFLVVDVDGFSAVNHDFGHDAGDTVLKTVALLLGDSVRGSDVVARLGADEFVVVLTSLREVADVAIVAEKMLRAIRRPIALADGRSVTLTASIGISLFPDDGTDPALLIRRAEEATSAAKARGRDTCVVYHYPRAEE